jgi:hypothetical protein
VGDREISRHSKSQESFVLMVGERVRCNHEILIPAVGNNSGGSWTVSGSWRTPGSRKGIHTFPVK